MKSNLQHFLFDGESLKALTSIPGLQPVESGQITDVGEAYAAATYAFRCIHLRANSLSQIPFQVRDDKGKVLSNTDGLNWSHKLPRLLWLTEASLCLHGAAYWFRSRNLFRTLDYRWLAPQTIKPVYDSWDGVVGFQRVLSGRGGRDSLNSQEMLDSGVVPSGSGPGYDLQDVVHFFLPDPEKELGPGRSPTEIALAPIGVLSYINKFSTAFFERGAIPAVMLSVKGSASESELKRLEQWWKRLLRGVTRAFETIAVRADVEPKIIGQPIKDLAMVELSSSMRGQIACAYGVPQTLLEDAANYGTAKTHRKSFYVETVIPSALLIQGVLNEQVFQPLGHTFEFVPEQLQIMQEEEAERSAALASLVGAGVPLLVALNILGFYVDDSVLDDLELSLQSKPDDAAGTDGASLRRSYLLLAQHRLKLADERLELAKNRNEKAAKGWVTINGNPVLIGDDGDSGGGSGSSSSGGSGSSGGNHSTGGRRPRSPGSGGKNGLRGGNATQRGKGRGKKLGSGALPVIRQKFLKMGASPGGMGSMPKEPKEPKPPKPKTPKEIKPKKPKPPKPPVSPKRVPTPKVPKPKTPTTPKPKKPKAPKLPKTTDGAPKRKKSRKRKDAPARTAPKPPKPPKPPMGMVAAKSFDPEVSDWPDDDNNWDYGDDPEDGPTNFDPNEKVVRIWRSNPNSEHTCAYCKAMAEKTFGAPLVAGKNESDLQSPIEAPFDQCAGANYAGCKCTVETEDWTYDEWKASGVTLVDAQVEDPYAVQIGDKLPGLKVVKDHWALDESTGEWHRWFKIGNTWYRDDNLPIEPMPTPPTGPVQYNSDPGSIEHYVFIPAANVWISKIADQVWEYVDGHWRQR